MSISRIFLAGLFFTSTVSAAELATLDGRKVTGEIVSIVGNDLSFKGPKGEEKFLVTTLNSVTIGPAPEGDARGNQAHNGGTG